MRALSAKEMARLFKGAAKGFSTNKVTKLGGSLAYFTIFSIGPMLLVVIFVAGAVLGEQAVAGSIYEQLHKTIGPAAARLVQQLIKSASTSSSGTVAVVVGLLTLLLAATTVFSEMHDSLDTIFGLEKKPGLGWRTLLIPRLVSFGVIASIGFLLLVTMAASALVEGLKDKVANLLPGAKLPLLYTLSQAFTLLVAMLLFSVIFKILPSAKLRWSDVLPGATVTALLFVVGRFAISFYIQQNNFETAYGAAGALVVLLVWIYYSSLILYFGAELTKVYANQFGSGIQPKGYAVWQKDAQPRKVEE